jgi:hypothetical protein
MKSSGYSMKNVAATVDGQPVIGVWDGDDAIVVAQMEDVGSLLVGADGASIFSQSANEAATITLRLMHTSPTHRLLSQKLARQQARGVKLRGFPVHVIDVDSKEGGSTDQAFIQSAPDDSKGKAATVREWVLVTGTWNRSIPIA